MDFLFITRLGDEVAIWIIVEIRPMSELSAGEVSESPEQEIRLRTLVE
jgi:hypothetical protein